MDLEFQQLDLRYEPLRTRRPERERRLLVSLSEVGQQLPIVVLSKDSQERHVVVDGYKRVRVLKRLGHDTVQAIGWEISEAEALWLERTLRSGDADSALEQGWFIRELRARFSISEEEIARRFDRSKSWVSRRLSLVSELPEEIQQHVRAGAIGAHGAMKYLVPLARANRKDCLALARAVAPKRLSNRHMASLYGAYVSGNPETRALLLSDPDLFLRAQAEAARPPEETPSQQLLSDLSAMAGIARRAHGRLRNGIAKGLLPPEREEIYRCFHQAQIDIRQLAKRCEKELADARPIDSGSDRPTP